MGIEIERKFLVHGNGWQKSAEGIDFRQGYLPTEDSCVVRVRIEGPEAVLTIKGRTSGFSRQEFEYGIPRRDANQILDLLCELPLIEKTRYRVPHEGFCWEIDVFKGENEGLIIAEIELEHENQKFSLPEWVGSEVSADPRFYNVNLVKNPYKNWKMNFPDSLNFPA